MTVMALTPIGSVPELMPQGKAISESKEHQRRPQPCGGSDNAAAWTEGVQGPDVPTLLRLWTAQRASSPGNPIKTEEKE